MSNELNKEISYIFDKIISKIMNYINNYNNSNNNNNQITLLDQMKSIYNYIKCKLSKEKINDKFFMQKEKLSLIIDINKKMQKFKEKNIFKLDFKDIEKGKNFIPTYQYIINRLKRELKEQHEKYKIQELGYLERISLLQKKLKIYEDNKKDNHNTFENEKNPKVNNLLNSFNKKKSNENSFIGKKDKKINVSQNQIKKVYKRKINNNKIFYQTFSNLRQNKKSKREIDISNIAFNNDEFKLKNRDNNSIEQNLIINKYLFSMKNYKIKKRDINTAIKYNFKEIKKEIEDCKRKVNIFKEFNSPHIYRKRHLLIGI